MRDIYSKRNKKPSDLLKYDIMDSKLRVQITRIWDKFFEQLEDDTETERIWKYIYDIICDEHGKHTLYKSGFANLYLIYKCKMYFEKLENLDECFDVLEIVHRVIGNMPEYFSDIEFSFTPRDVNIELNERFRENNFGYEYIEGKIIRVDNKFLHATIIDRVLNLTFNNVFENANEEFISALEHLKNHKNKEALNDCLKSFESTMKIICTQFGWEYTQKDTASQLIKICFDNELIPKYLQNHFTGLRTTLESGIPTIRNKRGGHGQGPEKIVVPDNLSTYSIYMTGSCINYLIELYNEKMPSR